MVAYLMDDVLGQGRSFDRPYRIVRRDTGAERHVHGCATVNFNGSASPVRLFGTIADVTEQDKAEHQRTQLIDQLRRTNKKLKRNVTAREQAEDQLKLFRTLIDRSNDAIEVIDAQTGRFLDVNEHAWLGLGYSREELLSLSVFDIDPTVDPSAFTEVVEALSRSGSQTWEGSHRRKDGTVFPVEVSLKYVQADHGYVVAVARDITERKQAEDGLRRSERNLSEAQRIAHIGSWEWDLVADTSVRSEELHKIYGVEPGTIPETIEAFRAFVHPDDLARVRESERAALSGDASYVLEYRIVRFDGCIRTLRDEAKTIRDEHGVPVRMIGTVQDVTERTAAENERSRLIAAVEQTADSVIISDLAGTIEYVNPAFEKVSGYRRDEVIGQNSRILQSGKQTAGFYRAMWRRLTGGRTWIGTLINRRKDGSFYEEAASISPIRGPGGEITGYVAVKRDVTALRAAESGLANQVRERAAVGAALSRLQPRESAEATAAAICDELAALAGIDIAAIFTFQDPGRGFTLAVTGPDGLPVAPGRPLPAARAAYLYERAALGPWAEAFRARPEDGAYGRRLADLGVKAAAYAPIRNGESLLGLILAGTSDATFASHLVDHLPIVGEFAATASALLAGQVEQGRRTDVVQARIKAILATGAFHPVFQPVVELSSGRTVGHEALTRFDDGTRPDEVFADAHAVGLGLELEAACLAAAIKASDALPPETWLSLNASPDLILEPSALPTLIGGRSRQIVLEVTEHAAIADYAAVRAALAALGPTVSLSVDDAGAGFASLYHVVELAPRFLKLDISLVRNVDGDPTRQAMIAGLAHFAGRTACIVIAEGIEDSAEREMLRELGVPLGQGYLFGRPEPLPAGIRQGKALRAATNRPPVGRRAHGGSSAPRSPRRRHLAVLEAGEQDARR